MYVGSFGDIPFIVARGYVRTFKDYGRESSGRWAKHDLIGEKPVLEFLGPDIEKINFKMQFRADHGMNPENEAARLRAMRDKGETAVLMLAGRPVGDNPWVVESIGETVAFWDAFGNAISLTVDVSLTEYPERLVVYFAPASEYAEILQNIRTILATPVYSVPLDRSFGVNAEFVDMPMPIAQAKIGQEIVTAIRKYEPRVSVTKITWEADQDGILKPKVQVRINDAT